MSATVTFLRVGQVNSGGFGAIVGVRAFEIIALTETTTTTAVAGEVVTVMNNETSSIRVAFGTTPDADATAEDGQVTSAGFSVPAGQISDPISAFPGMKITIEADD